MKGKLFLIIYFVIALTFIVTNEFIYEFSDTIKYLIVFAMLGMALIYRCIKQSKQSKQ